MSNESSSGASIYSTTLSKILKAAISETFCSRKYLSTKTFALALSCISQNFLNSGKSEMESVLLVRERKTSLKSVGKSYVEGNRRIFAELSWFKIIQELMDEIRFKSREQMDSTAKRWECRSILNQFFKRLDYEEPVRIKQCLYVVLNFCYIY